MNTFFIKKTGSRYFVASSITFVGISTIRKHHKSDGERLSYGKKETRRLKKKKVRTGTGLTRLLALDKKTSLL